MSTERHIQEFAGGEVCFWLEQESSIHLKAVSGSDPVELTARALLATAERLEALDSPKT
jgi:hypothetical protein